MSSPPKYRSPLLTASFPPSRTSSTRFSLAKFRVSAFVADTVVPSSSVRRPPIPCSPFEKAGEICSPVHSPLIAAVLTTHSTGAEAALSPPAEICEAPTVWQLCGFPSTMTSICEIC